MKYKIITILAVVMIGSIGAFGQDNSTRKLDRQERGDQRFIKLAEKLDLSPDQKKELFELMKEEKGTNKVKRGNRPSQDERLAAKSALDQKIAEILNEEQLAEYLKIDAKRNESRQRQVDKRSELKEYNQANVIPVMKAQRLKLDNLLNEEELNTIARIRNANLEIDGDRGGRRGSQMSKEDKAALKVIAKAHKDDIKSLMIEISEDRTEWQEETKEIKGDKKSKTKDRKDKMKERKDKNKAKGDKRGKRSQNMNAFRFLLLDPSN